MMCMTLLFLSCFFFFKQKTAYEMRISDWSSDVCSSDLLAVLDPTEKTIIHIPNVNSRESTGQKIKEVEHIIEELGEWQGIDPATGFQLVKTADGRVLRIADLVDDDAAKRDRVSAALKSEEHV